MNVLLLYLFSDLNIGFIGVVESKFYQKTELYQQNSGYLQIRGSVFPFFSPIEYLLKIMMRLDIFIT